MSTESPRHSSALADVSVADGSMRAVLPVAVPAMLVVPKAEIEGCESNSQKLPYIRWVAYAACRHVYRWCSPPSRAIDITSAFKPGRCSTWRWFGVSLSSES
jgi:hypothetical protein